MHCLRNFASPNTLKHINSGFPFLYHILTSDFLCINLVSVNPVLQIFYRVVYIHISAAQILVSKKRY